MRYIPLPCNRYIENRKRFTALMQPGALAIFNSNDEMPSNGDQTFPFRQNSDLLWLSGIDQELSTLIIFPDAPLPQYREILFLRKTNETIAIWEGHKLTVEEARQQSGIQTVLWNEEFDSIMTLLMNHCQSVYLNLNENDRCSWYVPYRDLRFAKEWKKKYPGHTYQRSGPLMAQLRVIKSEDEIKAMKTACNITRKAFERVLRFVKPGVMEYEIEAEITHEFIRNRANGHAYFPIIASGPAACVLHYNENNQKCKDGDVILLDFGADYANYAADMTRAIPVNGKFTKRQREVYDSVLNVKRLASKMLVPGNTLEKYHIEVGKLMEEELLKLKLITKEDIKNQNPAWPAYKKYFMHGTSHFLGLDVHDIGDRYSPMQAGMVFTCEPGIYIPEENLGIRIENDFLITDKGQTDLMADIPIEAEEIEEIMQGVHA
ncbi:MAG: aminopeptidase P N-terminal domain-containing protein [Bacteroidia bacterium]|nr:aminopeptidase P N-terminal domain-containing protein [Bacteroidia bacterium]MCZ2276643.1 aminopeptidase P N-terminal domain-containing protein [Bacteroidia bacterium]